MGIFVRSCKIGQWKGHFSETKQMAFRRLLEKHDISLSEFTLES
jgi:hypothetical protein